MFNSRALDWNMNHTTNDFSNLLILLLNKSFNPNSNSQSFDTLNENIFAKQFCLDLLQYSKPLVAVNKYELDNDKLRLNLNEIEQEMKTPRRNEKGFQLICYMHLM
jgi:hypothetical protein